jgi:hypothetical protein
VPTGCARSSRARPGAETPARTPRTGAACRGTRSSSTPRPAASWSQPRRTTGSSSRSCSGRTPPSTRSARDIEGHFMRSLELAPGLAERIRGGTRSEPFRGTKQLPNHRRRAYGDAGRWSETPATTRIRSLPSASATPSATPSCWPVPCTAGSRAASRSPTPLRDNEERPQRALGGGLREHRPVRPARAAVAGAAAALRRAPARPGADRPLLRHLRGKRVGREVLRAREPRPDHGRRRCRSAARRRALRGGGGVRPADAPTERVIPS